MCYTSKVPGKMWHFIKLPYSRVPSRTLCLSLETVLACPLPQKNWASLLHFCYYYCYLLVTNYISCYQTTPLLTILALADITLLKTTCHFLLLLVGFDTLTYRKGLQLTPYTCGSSGSMMHTWVTCRCWHWVWTFLLGQWGCPFVWGGRVYVTPRLNINDIHYSYQQGAPSFLGAHPKGTSNLSIPSLKQFEDGWPFGKLSQVRMSECKVHREDWSWYVGLV